MSGLLIRADFSVHEGILTEYPKEREDGRTRRLQIHMFEEKCSGMME
jgi:hypothetical protein